MDVVKKRGKKNLIVKTWERCQSFGALNKIKQSSSPSHRSDVSSLTRSKSRDCIAKPNSKNQFESRKNKSKAVPEGCFAVYVGAQKQRFVVKTKLVNHPLFKMLLDDAELEYGYNSEGPILLPCEVELFYKVLEEMKYSRRDEIFSPVQNLIPKVYCPFLLCSPARRPIYCENKDTAVSFWITGPMKMLQMLVKQWATYWKLKKTYGLE
ncbi:hypothetical protein I3843_11G003900 [Carya illinoinensis]|nr:hypothetical protein I3843_11G003900 [Carya illinoinensis]